MRPCTESEVRKTFSSIREEMGASVTNEGGTVELDTGEPLIKFGRESSFQWWASNKHVSSVKIARQYFCAPPMSVASERLLSGAGNMYDDKRCRLAPKKRCCCLIIIFKFENKIKISIQDFN